MRRKNDPWRWVMLLATGVATYSTRIPAEDRAAPEPALSRVRRASLDVFTLEVEVERPAFALRQGQGNTTVIMRVIAAEDVTAIVWKASKLPPPKYYPLGTNGYEGVDYDADGNLILWMPSEGATIRDGNIHEEYSEFTQFFVAPDGKVARRASGTILNRHDPSYSNTQGMSMLHCIRWALGRPPADDLGESEVEDAHPDGTREIRARGQYSPYSGEGVWSLVVDPAHSHLVRQASFAGTREEPRKKWLSEGTRWFGDLALAERGKYIHEPPVSQHIAVRLISFSPASDPTLIVEARRIIARAQTRLVQVYDYRDDSSNPKVKTVQAGDLDRDE